jgi:hypothetical protein
MSERVKLIVGKKPVILVAPHGCSDYNTNIIAAEAAKEIDAYAVINNGFDRADEVDVINDRANCNRVDHVTQDVVRQEFLDPLCKFADKAKRKLTRSLEHYKKKVLIFYIHGCGDIVNKQAGQTVSLIVGYGRGKKSNSFTCSNWRKMYLGKHYERLAGGAVFEGAAGGKYAARSKNNMNQYKPHLLDPWIESMQLEFPLHERGRRADCLITAIRLAVVVNEMIDLEDWDGVINEKII